MVPLWSTLLLTNFYVMRISFCHTNINIFRLVQKSSSKLFSSAKHELEIYIFGGKAIERAGALEPTTGTGNEKRRTLRKSTVSSSRFVDNIPLCWRGYAEKLEKMSDKICEAWPIFSLKRRKFLSPLFKPNHFWNHENSQHFAMPPVFTRNDVWETCAESPYWWRATTQIWVVLWKVKAHFPWPIRSTTQIWVVTRHQYGISAHVSQWKPCVTSVTIILLEKRFRRTSPSFKQVFM